MTGPQRTPANNYDEMQEYFSDTFETHVNPWSAAVTFGMRATRETEDHRYKVRMRMPLQLAKALAVMLLRQIRSYEQQTQTDIDLPRQVLDTLGIPPEDWERFKGTG